MPCRPPTARIPLAPPLAARNSLCLDAFQLCSQSPRPLTQPKCSPRNQQVAQQNLRCQSRTPAVITLHTTAAHLTQPHAPPPHASLDPANPSACVFYPRSSLPAIGAIPLIPSPNKDPSKSTRFMHADSTTTTGCALPSKMFRFECGEISARTQLLFPQPWNFAARTLAQSCNAKLDSLEREYPTQPRLGRCHHCEAFRRRKLQGGTMLFRCQPA
jgi:hypothetical protein